MSLFTPKMYYPNIYEIPYHQLKKKGIKCLLFDLDNTCVGYHEKYPTLELENLFSKLKSLGFRVIIFSNTTHKRIQPFRDLSVICHPLSKKPLKRNFNKIIKEYNYDKDEVCIIGDQLFTDILGGNRVGIMTCLVDPMTNEDFVITKFFRAIEKIIRRKQKINRGMRK